MTGIGRNHLWRCAWVDVIALALGSYEALSVFQGEALKGPFRQSLHVCTPIPWRKFVPSLGLLT